MVYAVSVASSIYTKYVISIFMPHFLRYYSVDKLVNATPRKVFLSSQPVNVPT